jgi:putative ABC transport system permease protein
MIKFLFKGLFRDKSRSLFPIIVVTVGAFISVLLYSWMTGIMNDMISATAKFSTGHTRIMTQAYAAIEDQVPNDLGIENVSEVLTKLRADYPDMVWVPRIHFGGLLDIPDANGETLKQGPFMGLGIDFFSPNAQDTELMNIEKSLVRGTMPKQVNEVLISDKFAQELGVEPGDTATLFGSTIDGSLSLYNFKVAGTVRFGITAMDRGSVIADVQAVQLALNMPDGASDIFGFSIDMFYNNEAMINLAAQFNQKNLDLKDDFSLQMFSLGQQQGMDQMLAVIDAMGGIIIGIFLFAMSLVLWNSGLMGSIRRYGEIGIRLAMGESKGAIYRSLIMESILIGIIGSVIGTFIGVSFSYYIEIVGWDFSEYMQNSSMMIQSVYRARVTPTSYYIGFFPGLIAPLFGTMIAGIGVYRRNTAELFKELEI